MNRPLLGLLVGGVLGVLDGSTAFFSAPELRTEIAGIIMGSSVKGLVAGLVTGFIVRRMGSLSVGVIVGIVVGFLLAIPVAYLNATYYENVSYWLFWQSIEIQHGADAAALAGVVYEPSLRTEAHTEGIGGGGEPVR